MKKRISKLTDLKYTLSAVNKALASAVGEVPTAGWKGPELGNDRQEAGVLHTDFLAEAPSGPVNQVISVITAQRSFLLTAQAQQITVHAETNEMSIDLPSIGDGP